MIKIRPFNLDDRTSLSEIYLRCRRSTFYWVDGEDFHLADFDKDTEGENILVATLASKQIGFISIWIQDNFVHHLFIDPDFQDQGGGKLLLTEGLKIVGRPARLKCAVQNLKACKFYEKNGWKIESTTSDGPTGPYHTYALPD